MTSWLDLLKASEILIGLVVGLFSLLIGIFAWWERRSRQYVDGKADRWTQSNADVVQRLAGVEDHLRRLDVEVVNIREQLNGMPTHKDYTEMKVSVAEISATLRQLNGMTQTLYKAAMRAGGDDRS